MLGLAAPGGALSGLLPGGVLRADRAGGSATRLLDPKAGPRPGGIRKHGQHGQQQHGTQRPIPAARSPCPAPRRRARRSKPAATGTEPSIGWKGRIGRGAVPPNDYAVPRHARRAHQAVLLHRTSSTQRDTTLLPSVGDGVQPRPAPGGPPARPRPQAVRGPWVSNPSPRRGHATRRLTARPMRRDAARGAGRGRAGGEPRQQLLHSRWR